MFSITGPSCFPVWRPSVRTPLREPLRPRSATLSCHVVSTAPFVLINCWAECVTSCQADCWCPSGHPSMPLCLPALLWQRRPQTRGDVALQDVGQYWEGRGGNPGAVCRSPVSRVSLRALPCDILPTAPSPIPWWLDSIVLNRFLFPLFLVPHLEGNSSDWLHLI